MSRRQRHNPKRGKPQRGEQDSMIRSFATPSRSNTISQRLKANLHESFNAVLLERCIAVFQHPLFMMEGRTWVKKCKPPRKDWRLNPRRFASISESLLCGTRQDYGWGHCASTQQSSECERPGEAVQLQDQGLRYSQSNKRTYFLKRTLSLS